MARKTGDIINHSEEDAISRDKPQWLRRRLDWFMNLRFGMIIHWAPYAQWDCIESWGLVPADTWARKEEFRCWVERGRDMERFTRDYRALNTTFNPTRFDPDAWAELAVNAGMKYIAFTTKHHDGFCMFDTRTTDYRVTHPSCPFHSHPRANIAKEVFSSFRRRGLAISCYFSKSDWHCPWYWAPGFPVTDRNPNYDTSEHPDIWEKFVRFVHAQVEELMTGYGPIDVLWLDGGQVRPPDQDIRMAELASMARKHQPGLIIADRTVGGEYEDFITPEQVIPEKPLSVPWESCITLGDYWKFFPNDRYKSAANVIHMLVETCCKGGNLLLGIGPDAEGLIPSEAASRLMEIGKWLKLNGESIYGSRPLSPFSMGNVRFTSRDKHAYAIVLNNSGKAPPPAEMEIRGIEPQPGSEVILLSDGQPVVWEKTPNGFAVLTGDRFCEDQPAWVLKFRVSGN